MDDQPFFTWRLALGMIALMVAGGIVIVGVIPDSWLRDIIGSYP